MTLANFVTLSVSRFNPRTPHGVRRRFIRMQDIRLCVSIHAPHTGCDGLRCNRTNVSRVSIHAPHTGCDTIWIILVLLSICFNPRTPHGVRHIWGGWMHGFRLFQSTHPTRGATGIPFALSSSIWRFNPRTPHGVRRPQQAVPSSSWTFQSTHPTRGATTRHRTQCHHQGFQSTHPTRGATDLVLLTIDEMTVSIHAPHTGCDYHGAMVCRFPHQVSIHAPHTGCDLSTAQRIV